jgi:hypothetical protein
MSNTRASRRLVLVASGGKAIASPASLAAASDASSSPPGDPLIGMCARWHELRAASDAASDDDAVDTIGQAMVALEEQIAATPATSRAGALAKLGIAELEFRSDEPCLEERTMLSALRDARRLLSAV